MLEIILINIVTLSLLFGLFYFRTKKLIYKYFDRHKTETQNFTKFIANIENRIKLPLDIKPHSALAQDNNRNSWCESEDWIVITSFNRGELLSKMIEKIKYFEQNIKIMVIDNGSQSQTISQLTDLKLQNKIDVLLLNNNLLTPQWQKSYSIAESMKLLTLRNCKTITIADDDIEISSQWLDISKKILEFDREVRLVNLLDDKIQENNHKTIEIKKLNDTNSKSQDIEYKLKATFNGAFFTIKFDDLAALGLPPIGEGISESSVEDWYYSRLFIANNWKVAALNLNSHLGYNNSIRENIG